MGKHSLTYRKNLFGNDADSKAGCPDDGRMMWRPFNVEACFESDCPTCDPYIYAQQFARHKR